MGRKTLDSHSRTHFRNISLFIALCCCFTLTLACSASFPTLQAVCFWFFFIFLSRCISHLSSTLSPTLASFSTQEHLNLHRTLFSHFLWSAPPRLYTFSCTNYTIGENKSLTQLLCHSDLLLFLSLCVIKAENFAVGAHLISGRWNDTRLQRLAAAGCGFPRFPFTRLYFSTLHICISHSRDFLSRSTQLSMKTLTCSSSCSPS